MAKHRIIPGHAGGTYHPWNVIEIPDHVHHDLHFARYIETGEINDLHGARLALNSSKVSRWSDAEWQSQQGKKGGKIAIDSGQYREMRSKGGKAAGANFKGQRWWTNGVINKRSPVQPDGTFTLGVTRHGRTTR